MTKKILTKPEVRPVGQGYDRRTQVRSYIFRVADRDGKVSHVLIPFGSASNKSGLLDAIGKAGFPVPLQRADRDELFDTLVAASATEHYRVISTSGWTGSHFVTPRRVYASGTHQVIPAMEHSTDGQRFRRLGQLTDWQREVAEPVRGNHLAMFGLAVAFASPLQKLLGVESGGFHLVGPSSIGKSTILVVAGSVWGGGGSVGFCNTWLSTSNALDDTANLHNDCFLALDETGVAGETSRDAARLVLHAAYRLTGGEGKARKNDQGPRQDWRLQFLGSTESTLQQLGDHAQATVAAGQSVRIVDIAADSGCDLGVWNRLPKSMVSAAELSDKLREAAIRLYGAPADRYLTRLVAELKKDKSRLIAWLKRRMLVFVKEVGASQLEGVQARVARRFALVYAAGSLACKYGILPWKRRDFLSAVQRCHRRVMWPAVPVTRDQSINLVRTYITRNKNEFLDLAKLKRKISKSEVDAVPGIIINKAKGRPEFVFRSSVFSEKVCIGSDWQRIWDHLYAAGLVNGQKGGKRTVTRDFPKPINRLRVISIKPAILDQGHTESS